MIPITILIVNNKTSEKAYTSIKTAVEYLGHEHHTAFRDRLPEDIPEGISKIVLSGGPGSIHEDSSFEQQKALILQAVQKGIPVFGICYGFQVIAKTFGHTVVDLEPHLDQYPNRYISGNLPVDIAEGMLFSHTGKILAPKDHRYGILYSDEGPLVPAAKGVISPNCAIVEAAYHKDHLIFGTQYHPENASPTTAAFEPLELFLKGNLHKNKILK